MFFFLIAILYILNIVNIINVFSLVKAKYKLIYDTVTSLYRGPSDQRTPLFMGHFLVAYFVNVPLARGHLCWDTFDVALRCPLVRGFTVFD